jgi:hypothetical protein
VKNETFSTFSELWWKLSPSWLRRTWGRKLTAALGDMQDVDIERAKASIRARYPAEAPVDTLTRCGADRVMPRQLGESWAAYAVRIADPWMQWEHCGNDFSILSVLAANGLTVDPTETFDPQDPAFVFDTANHVVLATAADFGDDRPNYPEDYWSKFWLLICGSEGYHADNETWDSGTGWDTWDADGVWDFEDLTAAELASWKEAIRFWKPGHTTCPFIFVGVNDADWGGVWGPWGTWADDAGDWDDDDEVLAIPVGEEG